MVENLTKELEEWLAFQARSGLGSPDIIDEVITGQKEIIVSLTKERDEAIAKLSELEVLIAKTGVARHGASRLCCQLRGVTFQELESTKRDRVKIQHLLSESIRAQKSLRSEIERKDAALKGLLDYATRHECHHEETHRGGLIWTICDQCGRKWADDEGGFQPYEEPKEITEGYAALAPAEKEGMQLTQSELFEALSLLIYRIEDCGASIGLTNAVTVASEIRQSVGNQYNPPCNRAADRVRTAVKLDKKMQTKLRNAPVKTISEVCGAEPGAFAKHLEEQKAAAHEQHISQQAKSASESDQAAESANKQYRDLVPDVDRWQKYDEYSNGHDWEVVTRYIIGALVHSSHSPGRRPIPEDALLDAIAKAEGSQP